MVNSGFKESQIAEVELPTVRPPVFMLFLKYLYTDQACILLVYYLTR